MEASFSATRDVHARLKKKRRKRSSRNGLSVTRVRRDRVLRSERLPSTRAGGTRLAGVRGDDGKRVFWTVTAGEFGVLVACRRKVVPAMLSAALGSAEPLRGEMVLWVSDPDVLPWRPESADGDAGVSLARVESPLYGTVFVACGTALPAGPLGVSSRGVDRLIAAVRSALNF